MKYYIDENMKINPNKIILNSDFSFGTSDNDNESWDFQISLNESSNIILKFNKETFRCSNCEGFIFLDSKKIIKRSIEIGPFKQGRLFFESNVYPLPDYGIECIMENTNIYYDDINNILAMGNIEENSETYEFGNGQYVKLKGGNIIAIYIKLYHLK